MESYKLNSLVKNNKNRNALCFDSDRESIF